jgi:hypothetical protein
LVIDASLRRSQSEYEHVAASLAEQVVAIQQRGGASAKAPQTRLRPLWQQQRGALFVWNPRCQRTTMRQPLFRG